MSDLGLASKRNVNTVTVHRLLDIDLTEEVERLPPSEAWTVIGSETHY